MTATNDTCNPCSLAVRSTRWADRASVHLIGPGRSEGAIARLTAAGYDITDPGRWLGVNAVVILPGWEDSPTVAAELAVARAFGRPVFEYVEDGAGLDFDLLPIDAIDQLAILAEAN